MEKSNITNNRQRIKLGLKPLTYIDRMKGIDGYDDLSNDVKLFLIEAAAKADVLDEFVGTDDKAINRNVVEATVDSVYIHNQG